MADNPFLCPVCEERDMRYVALLPQILDPLTGEKIEPHNYSVCRPCYRDQWQEAQTLPERVTMLTGNPPFTSRSNEPASSVYCMNGVCVT